jgi:hypothetical protein
MTREQALTIAENPAAASSPDLNAAETVLRDVGDTEAMWTVTREIDKRETAMLDALLKRQGRAPGAVGAPGPARPRRQGNPSGSKRGAASALGSHPPPGCSRS